ncbi:PREDICTED: pulmonary surfactant-associated protein D-like [Branchiostoma belcheri]|uniref:Pulmonary surfactant-associated protein D-like n=1 Tax=Branchiostoma belcheri TaxID=7741 RepID=A0A6P4XW00_BRABE|nr:PREDICTED: pulmonary surfactant-associated protein D-like [Branchiostoma belcheri]
MGQLDGFYLTAFDSYGVRSSDGAYFDANKHKKKCLKTIGPVVLSVVVIVLWAYFAAKITSPSGKASKLLDKIHERNRATDQRWGKLERTSVFPTLSAPGSGGTGLLPGSKTGLPGATGSPGEEITAGMGGQAGLSGSVGSPGEDGSVGIEAGLPGSTGSPGEQVTVGLDQQHGSTTKKSPPGVDRQAALHGSTGSTESKIPMARRCRAQWVMMAMGDQAGLHGSTGSPDVKGQTVLGSTGYPGSTGPMGMEGQDGVTGSTGSPELKVPVRMEGQNGVTGSTGSPELKDPKGVEGQDGVTGSTESPELKDPMGVEGQDGVTGSTGSPELKDSMGVEGQDGVTGSTGSPGSTGPMAVEGQDGVTGSSGSPELKDPMGMEGQDGVTGSHGALEGGLTVMSGDDAGGKTTSGPPLVGSSSFKHPETSAWRDLNRDCEIPDYVRFNGICYKSFTERVTFEEARQACAAEGGTLAMPKDSGTNTFIHNLAREVKGRWIGLSDLNNGLWVFEDGQTLKSAGYSNWRPGEPKASNQYWGGCVGFWYHWDTWDEKDCTKLRGFICELPGYM